MNALIFSKTHIQYDSFYSNSQPRTVEKKIMFETANRYVKITNRRDEKRAEQIT